MDNEVSYQLDASTRYKMSKAKEGTRNPNYGQPRDEETRKKISDSQRERHAKIRAFNEAAKLSAVKRIWEKERFSGFVRFDLLQYSEAYAIYSATDLSNPNKSMTYKVYYYFNDNLQYYDAISMEDATQFCEQFRNPDVQILANESKNKVVVLGLLGEDKTPRKKKR